MNTEPFSPPKLSDLPNFIRLANQSCNQALDELKGAVETLTSIDSLFLEFLDGLGDMTLPAAAVLIVNTHATFRASVRLALSGQLLPVYMTLRGAIESSFYANAMVRSPELADIWFKRDSGEVNLKKCRESFTIGKMITLLAEVHEKEFCMELRDLYDTSIDFGAHPNKHSMVKSIQLKVAPAGGGFVGFTYIYRPASLQLRQSVVACAETGLAAFYVCLHCHQKHPDFANIKERAIALSHAMERLVKELGLRVEPQP